MLEQIGPAKPRQIELGADRQEGEAGKRELEPPFAREHRVESLPERVEVENVGGGIAELLLRQRGGAPIGGLLLLRKIDAEEFAADILEPMPVGEGAGELGGDLGAIERRGRHIERLAQLARVYGAAQDAMSEEIVGRLAEAMSEGLSLRDRLNRGGAGRLVEMLAKLEASGSLERVAALLPTFADRLDMVGGLLESMETAAKQAESERTEGGIVSMYKMMTDSRTQETLRFMLALGQHMHERYARRP